MFSFRRRWATSQPLEPAADARSAKSFKSRAFAFAAVISAASLLVMAAVFRGRVWEALVALWAALRTAFSFWQSHRKEFSDAKDLFLYVLLILVVTPPSLMKTAIAIGFLYVAPIARVTRSVTLDLMSGEFIEAARARGERGWYVLLRELLPNVWPVLMVEASLRVVFAILVGAVLSFLGFGVQPPSADWGLMISGGRAFVDTAPWIALAPGLAMSLTVIAISLLGDGLREVLDPRVRGRL